MKERPILFSGPMVRAILDGRKTQTRRIVKPKPLHEEFVVCKYHKTLVDKKGNTYPSDVDHFGICDVDGEWSIECPYGQVGDRLWVREAFADVPCPADEPHPRLRIGPNGEGITWKADWTSNPSGFKWKPSIHMPRWASRITLEITEVAVERLNDISYDDCINEGWHPACGQGADFWYQELWNEINGPDSWAANPWVWVVSFKRIES